MGKYTIVIKKKAVKFLDSLDKATANPILLSISNLAENPRPFGYIKLKGRDACRIRVGNYRIIYEIQDNLLIVTVIAVGHRKDIYL